MKQVLKFFFSPADVHDGVCEMHIQIPVRHSATLGTPVGSLPCFSRNCLQCDSNGRSLSSIIVLEMMTGTPFIDCDLCQHLLGGSGSGSSSAAAAACLLGGGCAGPGGDRRVRCVVRRFVGDAGGLGWVSGWVSGWGWGCQCGIPHLGA